MTQPEVSTVYENLRVFIVKIYVTHVIAVIQLIQVFFVLKLYITNIFERAKIDKLSYLYYVCGVYLAWLLYQDSRYFESILY